MSLDFFETSSGRVFAKKTPSRTGKYFAIHDDASHYNGRLIKGRLWLFDSSGELFCLKKTSRPKDVAVSDNGSLIVGDWLDFDKPSCWIRIFDLTGRELYSARHRRNSGGVGLSSDGRIAIYSTCNPDALLRVVDVEKGCVIKEEPCGGVFYGAEVYADRRYALLDTQGPERQTTVGW